MADTPAPTELPPARPAATVVVVREHAGHLEVLMLKRSDVGAFPSFWVFPGGRVDDGDAGHDELSVGRSAAVREASEEVALTLEPESLVPWSHWTPPSIQPKRFTTWFFVAPWSGQEVVIDGHEIVEHHWMRPADALAAGLQLAPPTLVTVTQLGEQGSWSAVAGGPLRGVERFITVPARNGPEPLLLWHGDAGYEVADALAEGPRHRGRMKGLGLVSYERDGV